jgi:hypothetical protein
MDILKRHMDVIDEIKTFKDHSENIEIFNHFIQVSFKLLIQERLLNKAVIDDIKNNLNHITVDMEIFAANGRNVLQKLDVRSMLKLDS